MENVWKIVRKIRQSYLFENPDVHAYEFCQLSKTAMNQFLNTLTDELKVNSTSEPNKNVSYKTLETSAELFIYLHHCPPFVSKDHRFIAHMIQTGAPKELILSLTNLIKTAKNKKNVENLAKV